MHDLNIIKFITTFAPSYGRIRVKRWESHEDKRAFPLSSFSPKSGKFQLSKDGRQDKLVYYVARVHAASRRYAAAYRARGNCFLIHFDSGFSRARTKMIEDMSPAFLCNKGRWNSGDAGEYINNLILYLSL